MKRAKTMAIILAMTLILPGCEEVENPEALNEITTLLENIDLSAVSAPEEVSVYSAVLWGQPPEKAAGIFLGNGFAETKADAKGRNFVKKSGQTQEEIVSVHDGGRTYFGNGGHEAENGITYLRNDLVKIGVHSDGYEEMANDYVAGSGMITGDVPDENNKTFLAVKGNVLQYLKQLGMEGYALDAAASLDTKKKTGKEGCWMVWKQMIDGIPVSDTAIRHDEREVYNFRHGITNSKWNAYDSSLNVMYVGNELAEWTNAYVVRADKVLKKSPVVPVRQAYHRVKACYPPEKTGIHTLERAELQYELVEWADQVGKYYLYPVWVFTVHEETDNTDETKNWIYYLIDAITGDFFCDIPAELLQ